MGIDAPRDRRISGPGQFESWLVARDQPKENSTPGPSGHCWEIERKQHPNVEDRDIATSGVANSDESNGYTTGTYRLIEATPDGSHLHIWTSSDYIVQAFKGSLKDWRKNDYHRADGEPLAHRDYWVAIDKECQSRSITVSADLISKNHWKNEQKYKFLMRDLKREFDRLKPVRPGR